jgi:C4-dicarboxylate-binding protein DctP
VEKLSKGRIKVEIYPSNQLGAEREGLEGLKIGSHQMEDTTAAAMSNFFPPIQVMYIPYVFKSRAVAMKTLDLDTPFMQELNAACIKATGVRMLTWIENGPRHFVSKVKPIRTPADLKGQKIRIMESPVLGALVKSLGANPTPISWGELYTSMQQGVVDGMDQVVNLIDVGKFAEVSKYVTLDSHIYDPLFIWINESFFQSMPHEFQQIVSNAAREMARIATGIMMYWNDIESLEKIKAQGMEVYVPTEEEIAQFRELAQPAVLDHLKKDIDPEWLTKFLAAVKEAEAAIAVPK